MKKERKQKSGWIFWTPRIVSIIFILFLAMFSLDVFDPANDYTLLETLIAFLIHNIPVFILALALGISWPEKRGWIAGSTFILGGCFYLYFIFRNIISTGFEWYYLAWAVQIAAPAFFIGILFFIGWKKSR